jgi:WhiB family redox-sensing transcriptional regulator
MLSKTFGSEWRERAECIGSDPEIFVAARREGMGWSPNEALEICSRCSVTQECLDYAITTRQNLGVWGGKTPGQRERVKRLRRAEGVTS